MTGNTIGEFIDDLLMMGGPEKEFIFHNKYYFLETTLNQNNNRYTLCVNEYDNSNPKNKILLCSHNFSGCNFTECVNKFEDAEIFDGMTIYRAESEIEVLFG